MLLLAGYFVLACNHAFWRAILSDRSLADPATWRFMIAVGVVGIALNFVLLSLVTYGRFAKLTLSALILCAAAAGYFTSTFGVVLDADMLTNVLETDYHEARELLGAALAGSLVVHAAIPIAFVWWVRLAPQTWSGALKRRVGTIAAAWLIALIAVFAVYKDLAPLLRSQRQVRHLFTPSNIVFSTANALAGESAELKGRRIPVGTDAVLSGTWSTHPKPVLFLMIVGESVRADHLGINGYERQTTPQLAGLPVVNFPDVTACGTSTKVSLPCMFSWRGRANYDKERIESEEGLLNVLARAGFRVQWRDNQSGCKGVCDGDGIEATSLQSASVPGLCADGRCVDEILLSGLESAIQDADRPQLVVLHPLGSHGPEYFRRYPQAFRRFLPTCDTGELRKCTTEALVNTYDNGVVYTDHVIARSIEFLQRQSPRFATALLYVADHGESLGEYGLFLHGMPYSIAPRAQLHVPMVFWSSPDFDATFRLSRSCLEAQATGSLSHDNLFHSMLGLFDVSTSIYRPELDLFRTCKTGAVNAAQETEVKSHERSA